MCVHALVKLGLVVSGCGKREYWERKVFSIAWYRVGLYHAVDQLRAVTSTGIAMESDDTPKLFAAPT